MGVYYHSVIPPSLLNFECSLRTLRNEKNSCKLFLWDMYRTRGLEITIRNNLNYQYIKDVASYIYFLIGYEGSTFFLCQE